MSPQEFGVVAGGFVIVPHDLLDEAPDGSVVMVYISLYRHGHGSREGCWCSQQRLSQESGVYLKGVRKALLWLEEHGWVQGDHRSGRTAIYRVITQRHLGRNEPRSKTTQVENDLGGRSKTTQVPRSKTTYEQKPSNKNPRTKTHSPLPPKGEAPQAAPGTGKRKRELMPREITPADVPADLADCAELMCSWWGNATKARTRACFEQNCELLRRYSPEQRREILSASIRSGWQGLFPPRETRATGNGSHLAYGGHGSRAQANAAEAKRLLDQWEAQSAIPITASPALAPESPVEVFPWS